MKRLLALALAQSILVACVADTNRLDVRESGPPPSEFEREFAARTSRFDPQDKNTPGRRWGVLNALLDHAGKDRREAELHRLTNLAAAHPGNEFDSLLTQVFLDRLLKEGDSPRLVRLMAFRCPDYVGLIPIEFWLARVRGPQAIGLLAEAFTNATTSSSATVLAGSLSRAFPSLRAEFPVDRDFVRACARWAASSSTNLVLNLNYPYLPGGPLRPEDDPALGAGLFVDKNRAKANGK